MPAKKTSNGTSNAAPSEAVSKATAGPIQPDHTQAPAGGEIDSALINTIPVSEDGQLPVVGIGGSAGSIAPLTELFNKIRPDLNMAYVVVLHLSPTHESALPEIIQARTVMPVTQVQGRVKVEPNHVYVIPPGQHLVMDESEIHLARPVQPRGKRLAVDDFFRTLAVTHRSKSVAIILSGADGDGATGVKRIKEVGGVTIAQDPKEAAYDGMPRAAIETGMVDWILTIDQIADKLVDFVHNEERIQIPHIRPEEESQPYPDSEGEENDAAIQAVLAFLHTRTGHDFTHYKMATVLRRIVRRLQVNSLQSVPQYSTFLRTHPGEAGALLQDLLISVTNFFRDPEVFVAFQQLLPKLVRGKKEQGTVRVWVPGCATGEEAYSIAMLLMSYAETLDDPPEIQIFATDLDEEALRVAREGTYPSSIRTDVSPEQLRRFFTFEKGEYRVKKDVRERVLFAAHNLLRDAPFSRLDLVSCRNLLIYFDRTAQSRALDLFHFAIKVGGFLLLGSSESADDSVLFAAVDKKHRIYECLPVTKPQFPLPNLPLPMLPRVPEIRALVHSFPSSRPTAPASEPSPVSFGELHLNLLEQYAPPSLLVNQNYEIVHLSEQAGNFLRFVGGEVSINLLTVIHPGLRLPLRTALFRAIQDAEDVNVPPVRMELQGKEHVVAVRVRPLREPQAMAGPCAFALVIFDEPDAGGVGPDLEQPGIDTMAHRLEAELLHLKGYLRSTVEQYEASTEELKASNEELHALNEEQRSASEELETSREEIQAANEELVTLNQELKGKIEEVSRGNSDLQNLMASTGIATIFLDREFRIMRYTPRVIEIFRVIPTDLGRPLGDLRHSFEREQFISDAKRVLRDSSTIEREVQSDDGKWFLLRVLPYRTAENTVDGVVLTFVDITERREAVQALLESEERYRTLFNSIEEGFCVAELILDAGGETLDCRFLEVNPAFARLTGLQDAVGKTLLELLPDTRPEWLAVGATVALTGTPQRVERKIEESHRWFNLYAFRIGDAQSRRVAITFSDITELKQQQVALLAGEERLRAIINQATAGIIQCDLDGRILMANEHMSVLSGYSSQELQKLTLQELTHADDLAKLQPKMAELVALGRPFEIENRLLRKDGGALWMSASVSGVHDGQAQPLSICAVIVNINERREAERGLREANDRLESRVIERTRDLREALDKFHQEAVRREVAERGRDLLMRRLVDTQEEERRRISRELHDNLGQYLTAVMLGLHTLRNLDYGYTDSQVAELEKLQKVVDQLIRAAHRQAWELRPPELDDLGLEVALRRYIEDWGQRYRIEIDFQTVGWLNQRLSGSTDTTLYRVVQEALTNVAKHAAATQVSIVLRADETLVSVIVEDNGCGFIVPENQNDAVDPARLGLLGMRERMHLAHGSLDIETSPGSGTTLYARVPIATPGNSAVETDTG